MSILLTSLSLAILFDLRPRPADARLIDRGRELAPTAAARPAAGSVRLTAEHAVPGGLLRLDGNAIEFRRAEGLAWRVELPAGDLRFAAADGNVAWFTDAASPRTLARLELTRGAWLERWTRIGEGFVVGELGEASKAGGASGGPIAACVAGAGSLYCLFLEELAEPGPNAPTARSWRVSRIRPENGQASWSRVFRAEPTGPEGPKAFLLAPMRHGPWSAATKPLAICGDGLLVCMGGREPLLCLSRETGAEVWRLERPWEFERTYIGPSVWQYFVTRFGEEHPGFAEGPGDAGATAKGRERFEQQWGGAIAGGPFVVRPGSGAEDARGILLVVARAPLSAWASQLGTMSVLELSEDGRPLALAPLPKPATTLAPLELGDRVVLPLAGGAFACATLSVSADDAFAFPGGGSDRLGRLEWYRDPALPPRKAWLSTDPAVDACALSPRLCARVADGGYVLAEDAREMRFPLELLDPSDGSVRFAELVVPFEGKLTAPETNYSKSAAGIRTWGWRGLSISGLACAGEELTIVIADEKQAWPLSFRL